MYVIFSNYKSSKSVMMSCACYFVGILAPFQVYNKRDTMFTGAHTPPEDPSSCCEQGHICKLSGMYPYIFNMADRYFHVGYSCDLESTVVFMHLLSYSCMAGWGKTFCPSLNFDGAYYQPWRKK